MFFDFLPPTEIGSFLILLPTLLNIHKAVGPKNIPTKFLMLLNKDISNKFASLFSLSL